MTLLLSMALRASVLFGAAWLAASLLRRSSAAARHQVWAAAILCSLVLPLLVLVMPQWGSTEFVNFARPTQPPAADSTSHTIVQSHTVVQVTATRASGWNGWRIVLWVWGIGAAAMLVRLIAGAAQLFWAGSRARSIFHDPLFQRVAGIAAALGTPPSLKLLATGSRLTMPLTWGLFRPKILLPADALEWPADRLHLVLAHELAHVARHDWAVRICGELAYAIYWFHPLAWLAAARLREESERACDDMVLDCGVGAADYAGELLILARRLDKPARAWSAALAMARPSNFERRLIAMLNPSMNRRRPSAVSRTLTAVAALCLLAPLAGLRAPGQGLTGTLSGTVFDPSGGVVPGAMVTATNNGVIPTTTDTATVDSAGRFVFANLPTGKYELKAMARGFQTAIVRQVTLEAGRETTVNPYLNIGRMVEAITVTAPGIPRAPQTTAQRIRVGGDMQPVRLLRQAKPIYPPQAQAAGIEGTVMLEAVVGKDGTIQNLRSSSSGVDPELVEAARTAVNQWRYAPALLNGVPVEVITAIEIQFALKQ